MVSVQMEAESFMKKMPRLLILTDNLNPWHSFWVRLGNFLPRLDISYVICTDCIVINGLIAGVSQSAKAISEWDILFMYRYCPDEEIFWEALIHEGSKGKKIYTDIDDYLWWNEVDMMCAKPRWSKDKLVLLTMLLTRCNLITVSTTALLYQIRVMIPSVRVRLIVNNAFPKKQLCVNRSEPGTLRLGWSGAAFTRKDDLMQLKELALWSNSKKNVSWVHLGWSPLQENLEDILNIDSSKIRNIPILPYAEYVNSFDFDIGLAPLARSIFNYHKSDIKVIEYSSVGIPWIASYSHPYIELKSKWGRICRLSNTPAGWIKHAQDLIQEKNRIKEGETLASLAQLTRSRENSLIEWAKLFECGIKP